MKQLTITSKITNRDNTSFNLYLKDIYSIAILTPKEETELAIKAYDGDVKAKEELVRRNLRFVVSVAKKYATSNVPLEDLVNEGNIGLINAADKFQPLMGWKFISYAVWWIRKEILKYLSNHGKTIRLPANKINSLSKLDKKIAILEQKFGRTVDIQEIVAEYANEFESADFELLDILSTYNMDSLDREIGAGEDGSHTTLGDILLDDTSFNPSDYLLIRSDIKSEIARLIDTLKVRDKRIMTALYGLDGNTPMTLKEVGDEIGVTREMIRQIKEKNLIILKNKLSGSSIRS